MYFKIVLVCIVWSSLVVIVRTTPNQSKKPGLFSCFTSKFKSSSRAKTARPETEVTQVTDSKKEDEDTPPKDKISFLEEGLQGVTQSKDKILTAEGGPQGATLSRDEISTLEKVPQRDTLLKDQISTPEEDPQGATLSKNEISTPEEAALIKDKISASEEGPQGATQSKDTIYALEGSPQGATLSKDEIFVIEESPQRATLSKDEISIIEEGPKEADDVNASRNKASTSSVPSPKTEDATPPTTIDTSLWTNVEKEFFNYFAFKEEILGVPLTHWRMVLVFNAHKPEKLSEMCRAAFANLHSKNSQPGLKSNVNLKYRILRLGPETLSAKDDKSFSIRIDILQCAKNWTQEFYLTKGRRDNSVYFVKPLNSEKNTFVLDTNFETDQDLNVNFLAAAKKVLKDAGMEW